MKRLLFAVLLMTAVAFGQQGNPQNGNKPQAKVLSRAEFDALIANPSGVLLIDVRRPDEISSNGGFPVYLNIQIGDLAKELAWIPKDRALITVSNHAARGSVAADLLAKNGFNVAGTIGTETYEQAGGTLTRIVPPPAQAARKNAAANKN
jgi:rhodanese-related sulfurtransferase